jgi:hypothetical protein
MRVNGKIVADRVEYYLGDPIVITLELTNPGQHEVHVFVPHGRSDGLQIAVRQTAGFQLRDMTEEPDTGMVPETRLAPSQTYRQAFPLSQWLVFTAPGTYYVQCSLPVRVASASLRQADADRDEETLTVSDILRFRVLSG